MHKKTNIFNFAHSNFIKLLALSMIGVMIVGVLFSLSVRADGVRVVVTGADSQGWYSGDTTDGGAITYFSDSTSPYPSGVLSLTTNETEGAKAQYLKNVDVPLAQVTDLSYYTKQVGGPAGSAASYQLNVALHGSEDWVTALVFDPSANGGVLADTWQKWDVRSGRFWASGNVPPIVTAGNGAAPYYTLDQLNAAYPHARVLSFGVYAGTFDPYYNVGTSKQNLNLEVDGVTFNTAAQSATYDFEIPSRYADSKDQCKDGGWMSFQGAYTNQGHCVSSVVSSN